MSEIPTFCQHLRFFLNNFDSFFWNSQNCSVSSGFHCRVITGSLMRLYYRASTNFQSLEFFNFLPLKFGGSTENFRKFQFATQFYRNSSICISWRNKKMKIKFFLFFFLPFFFLLFYFIFIFFLVLNFQGYIKSFLVFLFFNRTKCGKCAFTPQKNIHTCAFIWENVLAFRGTTDFAEHAFWLEVVIKPVKLV